MFSESFPLLLIKSKKDFLISLLYWSVVFWKAKANLIKGFLCCWDIIAASADCCDSSVNWEKSSNALFSASSFVKPSFFIYVFALFL